MAASVAAILLIASIATLCNIIVVNQQPVWAGTFPGQNGQIAFYRQIGSNYEIHVMNADGSGQTRLTNNAAHDFDPSWSPDGTKIAFWSQRDFQDEIYVMNADGSGQTNISNNPEHDYSPSWSPDGTKIAFGSQRDFTGGFSAEIYVMNADGSGQTRLTNNAAVDFEPSWSPDGTKIAFHSNRDAVTDKNREIYVMNAADGSGVKRLTCDVCDDINDAFDHNPSWSPDGTKIAFESNRDGNWEIYVMNAADGSRKTRLTNNAAEDSNPSWSPDGTKIAFFSLRDGNGEIYVMNAADGSGVTRLTNNAVFDDAPDWGSRIPPPPATTTLTLNTVTSVPWGKDVTVTGKLSDASNGAGIGGKTITFDGTGADNLPDNTVTNSDGTFTAKGASPNTVATGWTVQAHFAGDSTHSASDSAIKSYNTLKHSVTLLVSAASTVPWGKQTTFTATLTDTSMGGVPIEGKTIHFDGTGVIPASDKTTDSNGKAIATGTAPNTVATGWTYQAHFAGDSLYLKKDTTVKTYSTTKHAVSLVVSAASTVPWGRPTTFTATLKDTSMGGVPIEGKTIHFDGTGVIGVTDKTTDSSGKAIATGTAPDTVNTGWTYQAHFAGDSLYLNKDSTVKTYSTTKHATSLTLALSPSTVASDKTYKAYGVLKDSSTGGTVISSKTITFTADSPITIADKTTDSAGKYDSGSLPAPDDAGTYDIQSHFAGDSLYNAKDSVIKTLTVTAATTTAATADTADAATAEAPTATTNSDTSSTTTSSDADNEEEEE